MEAGLINHCRPRRLIKETGLIKNSEPWSHCRFIDPEVLPQGLQDVPPVNCHLGRLTLGLLAKTSGEVESKKHAPPCIPNPPQKHTSHVAL